MVQLFADWVAGTYTPEDAESFVHLRQRAVAAVNRVRPAAGAGVDGGFEVLEIVCTAFAS